MTAARYRNLLFKQWPLVALCIVLAGTGAGISSRFVPPVYQSMATLRLDAPSEDTLLLAQPEALLQTEVQLVTGQSILTEVSAQFAGVSVALLRREVSAAVLPDTVMVQITVLDHSPTRAADLANALAYALIAQQEQAQNEANAHSEQHIRQDIATTQNQINTTTEDLAHLQQAQHPDPAQIEKLQTQLANLHYQYTQFEGTLSRIQLAELQTTIYLRVSDAAQVDASPAGLPLYAYVVAGLVFGLLLGLLLVLLRGQLDQRVPSLRVLEDVLGCPILAELPSGSLPLEEKAGQDAYQATRDAYQMLDSNLELVGIDTQFSSLAVIGAAPDGRASVVAGNLALHIAESGKKTLLIDANFSHPSQDDRFEIISSLGLSDLVLAWKLLRLDGTALPPRFIYRSLVVDLPTLRVLPAGAPPAHASRVLASKTMQTFLKDVVEPGDKSIVLDAPSPLESASAAALAACVDGVIVVVELEQARRHQLARLKARLKKAGARVLGCVVSSEQVQHAQPEPDRRVALVGTSGKSRD
ncbi:MAG TPA: Wzz/FepE/Etk N-terminal domain-containing protein [Ktedonobacterales bacterium]|nr:Wzz/FepE/Etk N-terminal domain-containing protein [Ktedonobacterales bacterium]